MTYDIYNAYNGDLVAEDFSEAAAVRAESDGLRGVPGGDLMAIEHGTKPITLRSLGITTADNIKLDSRTLDMLITQQVAENGCEIYRLADGSVVLNNPSGPTLWWETAEDAREGDPSLQLAGW